MNINPITSYNKNNNQPSFQAVNTKYLERAQKEIKNRNTITDDLLYCLRYDVIFKNISFQDGVDTIKAIRKLLEGNPENWKNWINELVGEFKYLAKKERIEQRREAKKPKSCQ